MNVLTSLRVHLSEYFNATVRQMLGPRTTQGSRLLNGFVL